MSKDVFLSHSTENAEIAKDICTALEDRGIDVWMAPRDIPGGKEWGQAIVNGIESSNGIVFLSSRHAHQSTQTRKEIEIADEFGKPIIPVRLDETEPPAHLKFHIALLQWIDVGTSPTEQDYERIAEAIREECGVESGRDDEGDADGVDADVTDGSELEEAVAEGPQSGKEVREEIEEAIGVLREQEEDVAEQVADAVQTELGGVPIELERRSVEFVEELRETLVELEKDLDTTDSYVVLFSNDGDVIGALSGRNQTDAMREATDYLIEHRDLIENIEDVPWVPGNKKAILNDTDEWEDSVANYYELESGYFLDTRLSKEAKKRELRRMADRCGVAVEFAGEW